MNDLVVADKYGHVLGNGAMFRKAPEPMLGEKFGLWAGRENEAATLALPGGGVLAFDLSRLTLADYRSMRSHYQIHISLMVLAFLMHELDWKIECADDRIRIHCEENMRRIWTRLIRGICTSHWAGFSPIVLQFENDLTGRRVMIDQVKDLLPEECTVYWDEVQGYAPPGHARPKHKIFGGIKQRNTSWPIPVDNCLWVPCLMESGDFYGRKLLKPAFPSWFFSQIIHLFANRYFERFGEPTPVGRAPLEEKFDTGGGVTKTGREIMDGVLRNLRNRSVVVLPNDRDPSITQSANNFEWDITYLESQMRGADFERYLDRLDEEMSLALFTPVLLFRTADVGSYNLGAAHHALFMTMLNALAGDIKYYLDRYLLARMVDMNFSPNSPRAEWVPRKLGKDNAETLRAMVQSLITQKIAQPSLEELGVALGLSIEEISVVTAETNMAKLDAELGAERAKLDAELAPTPVVVQPGPNSQNALAIVPRMFTRAKTQIEKAFREGTFDGAFKLDLGHQRQLVEALSADGNLHPSEAAEGFVRRVDSWFSEVASLGGSLTERTVLQMLDQTIKAEINRL